MRKIFANGVLVCASLLVMGQACTTPSGEQSVTFLRTIIETGALNELGPPGDAVAVLANLPEATKTALILHINRRLVQAELAGDDDKVEWLQANQSCISAGQCGRLQRLQRERARTGGGSAHLQRQREQQDATRCYTADTPDTEAERRLHVLVLPTHRSEHGTPGGHGGGGASGGC